MMDHVVMDFIGPLTVSERGYTYVLLLVDHTKFIWLVSMIEKTAVEVAYELVKIFAGFGVPKILQSDNEPSFVGEVIKEFSKIVGFEHRKIMKYFQLSNKLDDLAEN